MEKVEINLHEARAIIIKLDDIEETSKFLTKEIRLLRSFLHGKCNLTEEDSDESIGSD